VNDYSEIPLTEEDYAYIRRADEFCRKHGHHPMVPCDHTCKLAVFPELDLFIED
jgi:hypothetical protein